MDYINIDRFIERYAEERHRTPKQIALQHLLSHAYMTNQSDGVDTLLKQVRVHTSLHIETLALFDNPLCNAQISWLLFFPIGFAFSLYMLTFPELVLPGLIYCAATLIYGTSLLIMVIQQWMDNDIRIAYYREIIDFIDSWQP